MRPAAIALAAGSAVVALGGVYLLFAVQRGSASPSDSSTPSARREPAPDVPPRASATSPRPSLGKPLPPAVKAPPMEIQPLAEGPPPVLAKLDAELNADSARLSPEGEDQRLEANKLYDRGDYEGARAIAIKTLGESPGNVKLLRVVVSSSCILGDSDTANQYAAQLPPGDRAQMAERCSKFQIALK